MREQPAPDLPDLILERYRLGELPAADLARVERLAGDDRLRDRLSALEASDRDINGRYPATVIARRAREYRSLRGARRQVAFAAAAIGTIALALAVALPWLTPAGNADEDRIKGLSPLLLVYRQTPGGSETLASGAPVRAGDLLRVGYVSAGRTHGVIVSIDGRGIVTLHLPPEGGRAAALRAGTVLLDTAFELDDAPAFERFYFVTATHPFDVAPVMEAARRAAAGGLRAPPSALSLEAGFEQTTFSLQKEVRP